MFDDPVISERVKSRLVSEGYLSRHKADRPLAQLMVEDAEYIGAAAAWLWAQETRDKTPV